MVLVSHFLSSIFQIDIASRKTRAALKNRFSDIFQKKKLLSYKKNEETSEKGSKKEYKEVLKTEEVLANKTEN